jgi:phage baseplate assembly protein W
MSSYGLAPTLPLVYDDLDGPYRMIKNYRNLVTQNFKMLLLTSPGERIMIPDYGVGLRNYIFQQSDPQVYDQIRTQVLTQIKKYMPYITLTKLEFSDSSINPELQDNYLNIRVEYYVVALEVLDVLDLTVDIDTKVFI